MAIAKSDIKFFRPECKIDKEISYVNFQNIFVGHFLPSRDLYIKPFLYSSYWAYGKIIKLTNDRCEIVDFP
jgi:hypothetical protein